MLPPFIIDQIRRREERDREDHARPFVELPVPAPVPTPARSDEQDPPSRGVVVIDL